MLLFFCASCIGVARFHLVCGDGNKVGEMSGTGGTRCQYVASRVFRFSIKAKSKTFHVRSDNETKCFCGICRLGVRGEIVDKTTVAESINPVCGRSAVRMRR